MRLPCAQRWPPSITPERGQAVRCERGVVHCLLAVALSQVVLDGTRIKAPIRHVKPTRMPQHRRVEGEGEASTPLHRIPASGDGVGYPETMVIHQEQQRRIPHRVSPYLPCRGHDLGDFMRCQIVPRPACPMRRHAGRSLDRKGWLAGCRYAAGLLHSCLSHTCRQEVL
jgi:hypothetical protein